MSKFLRNPITLWFKYLWQKLKLERLYKNKHLQIGYMSFAKGSAFGQYNTIYEHVRLENVALGDYTYIAKKSEIKNAKLGKFCSIGDGCKIGLGIHPTGFVSSHPLFYSNRQLVQISLLETSEFEEYKKVIIGNDVWIGTNVLIKDGVVIGNGSIIAAGSVVTKDVPAYAIVGGVPAKEIRYRFAKNICLQLEESKWWDKELQWLASQRINMLNPNKFIQCLQNKENKV